MNFVNFSATRSPVNTLADDQCVVLSHSGESECGTALTLTDAAREAAIKLAGIRVDCLMWQVRESLLSYDISNSLLDKADADRYRLKAQEAAQAMASLIKGRSPAYVAQLEAQRGLD